MDGERDEVVVGAGLAGLRAALARRESGANVVAVDAAPRPGGTVATQRSNGFVCELGPFAFAAEELAGLLALLRRPPATVPCAEHARTGWLVDGANRQQVPVDPVPVSFATGNEELVQACRRDLDGHLMLGRAVTRVVPRDGGGFELTLGGEATSTLTTPSLVLAIAPDDAGKLLGSYDPALPDVATRVEREPRAFVWFGGDAAAAPELRGYGAVAADGSRSELDELIFCSEVFPRRALPGRCLVRAEILRLDHDEPDDAVLARAQAELRRWTGTRARFDFTKVHRFDVPVRDGAWVECRLRLAELERRVPGLSLVR